MKKLLNIVLAIGFCLMFCFLAVGYAALNDELHVTGTVTYKYVQPPLDDGDTVVGGDVELEGGGILDAGLYIGYGTDKEGNSNAGSNSVRFPMYARTESDQSVIYYSVIDTSQLNDLSKYLAGDDAYDTEVLLCVLPENVTAEPLFLYLHSLKDVDDDDVKDNAWKSERARTSNIWKNTDTEDAEAFQLKINTRYVLYFYGVTKDMGNDAFGKWELVETGSTSNTPETTEFTLDTTAVTNLTIESQELQTMDLSSRPNLLLTLTPAEGYLLPETFIVTISGTEYAISTAGENETETMLWEAETSTLYILGDILPTDGSPVVVTAHAVPEVSGFTLNTDILKFMAVEWHTANGCLNLSLTPEEGYLLPESLTVTINDNPYTVYTTPEGENPAGMGYDPIENILTIHFSLIPQDALITLTGEAIPEEGETEPTEESTDPTGETTDSV